MMALISVTRALPKGLPPNTITLGARVQHMSAHKHSGHTNKTLRFRLYPEFTIFQKCEANCWHVLFWIIRRAENVMKLLSLLCRLQLQSLQEELFFQMRSMEGNNHLHDWRSWVGDIIYMCVCWGRIKTAVMTAHIRKKIRTTNINSFSFIKIITE
jgi:hypothetical protein